MSNKLEVKVKKVHPDAVIPQYARPGDAGFDLVAVEDVIIQPGETKKVPTGLAFAIPPGYELQIRPRSGVSKDTKLRISNAPGTVDAGYRGEIGILVDNIHPGEQKVVATENRTALVTIVTPHVLSVKNRELKTEEFYPVGTYLIRKGDRIAQGVIAPVYQAQFEVVDELDETERGTGGFGSTGISSK